jgi:hypothetical protein
VILVPTVVQVAEVHPDTFDMLLIAEDLAGGAPSAFTQLKLGLFGLGLPLLHSPARWLGVAFFYSLPAAFSFTLVAALRFFCDEGLQRLGYQPGDARRLANLVTLLFASTVWIIFQFVYHHNSNIAATFALLGVGSLWLALLETEKTWLCLGSLALLGFSLVRVETVIFALAFLAVAIAANRFHVTDWVRVLLPLVTVVLAWYGWLLLVARPDTKFLTAGRLLAYLAVIAGFYAGVSALNLVTIRRVVAPHLSRLTFAVLGCALGLLVVIYPDQAALPVWSTIVTLFLLGLTWWGLTWWLAVAATLILARAPQFPQQRLLTGVVLSFFMLYLIFGIAARGYAIAHDGSGNRMALHILPVIFLYLTLRSAPYLVGPSAPGITVGFDKKTARSYCVPCDGLL